MPPAPSQVLDKSAEAIRDMFAGVAPRYDLLNRLLSARRDVAWRRRAAAALGLPPGARAIDLCCGTGDQALALAARGARVTSADFCLPMLALARSKYRRSAHPPAHGLAGDTLELPFADATFEAATLAFGLRNLTDLDRGLREVARVLRPGAGVAFLEFAVPRARLLRRLYLAYFTRLLPRIGSWLSPRGTAYGYLPASVLEFPQRGAMVQRMTAAGLAGAGWQDLTGGITCLYTARREAM